MTSHRLRTMVLACALLASTFASGPAQAGHSATCTGNLPYYDDPTHHTGAHYSVLCRYWFRGFPLGMKGTTGTAPSMHIWVDANVNDSGVISPPIQECRVSTTSSFCEDNRTVGSIIDLTKYVVLLDCHAEIPVGKTGTYFCASGTGI